MSGEKSFVVVIGKGCQFEGVFSAEQSDAEYKEAGDSGEGQGLGEGECGIVVQVEGGIDFDGVDLGLEQAGHGETGPGYEGNEEESEQDSGEEQGEHDAQQQACGVGGEACCVEDFRGDAAQGDEYGEEGDGPVTECLDERDAEGGIEAEGGGESL